jgi:hypothetical protein
MTKSQFKQFLYGRFVLSRFMRSSRNSKIVNQWLDRWTSPHTRSCYRRYAERMFTKVRKPLNRISLGTARDPSWCRRRHRVSCCRSVRPKSTTASRNGQPRSLMASTG